MTAGDLMLKAGRYAEAVQWYEQAGEAGAAAILRTHYAHAEDAVSRKAWDEASQWFKQAGDYLDAQERTLTVFRDEGDIELGNGKFEEAIQAYGKAGEAGAEWIARAQYAWAEACLSSRDFTGAQEHFTLAGSYRDAAVRVHEPSFIQGQEAMEAGQYPEAAAFFEDADGYPLAAEKMHEAWYLQGEKLLAEGEYESAADAFALAGEYRDARDMISECWYRKGTAAAQSGSNAEAFDSLRRVRGYKDTDDILRQWKFREIAQDRENRRAGFSLGKSVCMGSFMQDNATGKPSVVEWFVIHRDGSRVLLTTRYLMDASAYSLNGQSSYLESSLRSYLQESFLTACFDDTLRQALIPQEELGNDLIFPLSRAECDLCLNNGVWNYMNRAPTRDWARRQGIRTMGNVGRYWLRDEGSGDMAWAVQYDGSCELVRMDDTGVGVRPACWIDLDILYPQ